MESIAVMIPVFRRPKMAGDIAAKLLRGSYTLFRIVVVVDGERNAEIDSALDPVREHIDIVYNNTRRGKTESLMSVAKGRSEDLFLFFDNDVEIPDDPGFLARFAEVMRDADITDFPKEAIATSLVGKMIQFEFLTSAFSEMLFARVAHRCPAVMGATLGIRRSIFEKLGGFRKIVCEDIDLGARAFHEGARFAFDPSLKVRTEVPNTIQEWIGQRKRWAVGNVVWFNEHFLMILKHAFSSLRLFLSALTLFLPTLALAAIFFAFRSLNLATILPAFYLFLERLTMMSGVFFWISFLQNFFDFGLIPSLIGLGFSGLLFGLMALRLRFRFRPISFLLFYLVYSPLWVLTNVIAWFLVLFKVDVGFDWKT